MTRAAQPTSHQSKVPGSPGSAQCKEHDKMCYTAMNQIKAHMLIHAHVCTQYILWIVNTNTAVTILCTMQCCQVNSENIQTFQDG